MYLQQNKVGGVFMFLIVHSISFLFGEMIQFD